MLIGKERVMEACDQSAAYLKTVTTTFDKFMVVSDPNNVVIDTVSAYVDAEQQRSRVASCDWYRFEEGVLVEITSYTIDLIE